MALGISDFAVDNQNLVHVVFCVWNMAKDSLETCILVNLPPVIHVIQNHLAFRQLIDNS